MYNHQYRILLVLRLGVVLSQLYLGNLLTTSAIAKNHIDNHNTTQIDDYSASVAEMQTTTDPYPGGSESQATSLAGELERIRFVLKQITGNSHWYIDPPMALTPVDPNFIVAVRMFS